MNELKLYTADDAQAIRELARSQGHRDGVVNGVLIFPVLAAAALFIFVAIPHSVRYLGKCWRGE